MASSVVKSESQIRMDLKKELHNDFYEFLVCQNCEAVPKEGPIYTCDNATCDFATCKDCWQITKKNICKCLSNVRTQSKVLEKLRTTLPLSCKFRKNGCNTILTLDSLLYHEVDCQRRPIFCPRLSCISNTTNAVKIIFNLFAYHLTEHHTDVATDLFASMIESHFTDITAYYLNENCENDRYSWPPRKLTLNGAQFFIEMVLRNDRFYIWLYYYGSKEEAKNYSCTIRAYGGPDNEEFIGWSAQRSNHFTLSTICNIQYIYQSGKNWQKNRNY
jgi:hypothetical protein